MSDPLHPLIASCTPPAGNACKQSAPPAYKARPPVWHSAGTETKAADHQTCTVFE
ncbi:hypothetical protein [Limnobacter sp. P1]|uniref:hypothetical protein n=1 Tax=Limnobacter olei TaxID=3031298 RepID=UPI0023B1B4FC|nr:hypothetical protein [Limnobacter sp. P1]